jgi:hypothetical protein
VASEERKAFLLRVPPELWKELEKWAADDLRSINAQIEFLLRQAVARRKSGPAGSSPMADNPSSGSS